VVGGAFFSWHDYDVVHPAWNAFIGEWRVGVRDIKAIPGVPLAYWKSV
jgi:hypothetical protein